MSRSSSILVLAFTTAVVAQPAKDYDRSAKWEKEVTAIEKKQADNPPPKGGIVFTGSSTIRLWDLAKSFPDWKATNSGFGGSEIRDVTYFADRLVFKHEPRAIVFYAGDNDINSGRTPEQVLSDFKAFVEAAHKDGLKRQIFFIAVKPSPARWGKYEAQTKANELVKAQCEKDHGLTYIDVVPLLLGKDGQPREELYVKDRLHLAPAGYEILAAAVKKAVK